MLRNCSPYTFIILSFLALIMVGTLLLSLPFAHVSGGGFTYFEALFTATSAVTVTGLTVCDVHSTFSIYGEVIVLLLIQLGGLGILTLSSVIILLITKKISFYTKRLVSEGLNHEAKIDLYSHIKKVVFVVLLIEAIGAALLFFHSVSAFCNAGISLFRYSLEGYTTHWYMNIIISLLVIFGGLGFTAIIELYEYLIGKRRKISVNSKFSTLITLLLLGVGTFLFFILEYRYTGELTDGSVQQRLLVSFFHSASLRTAGFSTVSLAGISGTTALLCMLLMFIGASPNSTGSGIKTTTFGILYLGVRTSLLNKRYIEYSKRRISWQLFNKASTLVFIASSYIMIMAILMMYFDRDKEPIKVLFELMSAFSTCGLSMVLTSWLSTPSQVILLITMFLGRVGPLTIVLAFSRERNVGKYKYPKENILIG